ncbi:MAG: hypothetical protein DELT_01943 [Desulfovibrio sp.]
MATIRTERRAGQDVADRVTALFGGAKRKRKILVSPEGVPLEIVLATRGERLTAFTLDLLFMFLAIGVCYILMVLLFFSHTNTSVGMTVILFITFVIRNLYFIHFELAWQGRTPGKKICNLRVISRDGGELTPSAVIARNLTREVEVFLPISLMFSLTPGTGAWQQLTLLGWVLLVACLPLFNRDHLRAGDIIAGTQVIIMPKRVLLGDLVLEDEVKAHERAYVFTHDQLAVYGAFELQVLEELLRRPDTEQTRFLLDEVCGKICKKIGWDGTVSARDARRFLTDFYTAERADLERGQLFGNLREDKTSGR